MLKIVRDNITNIKADAIVNTANPKVGIGDGVDRAIHKAAGPELIKARANIGEIAAGNAVITKGYDLSPYIIHAVTMRWVDGLHGEEFILKEAYKNALNLALQYECKSIAFPLMGAGTYGFPKEKALIIAKSTCEEFLLSHDMEITLVVFDETVYALSKRIDEAVCAFISEEYVNKQNEEEYLGYVKWADDTSGRNKVLTSYLRIDKELDERVHDSCQRETFSDAVKRIIQEQRRSDAEVYNAIGMNRATFNKIINNREHRPTKKTVLQLIIGLHLNLKQAQELLKKAGYSFTETSITDIIFTTFISRQYYDCKHIDELLDRHGQPTVFSEG